MVRDAAVRTIQLVDHDPAWARAFENQRQQLLQTIGAYIDEVHHVGSTSIAGLCAKPKIDIDCVLRAEALLPEAVERIKSQDGYTFHGDPYQGGMWTFTQGHGSWGTRLYLCGPDNRIHRDRMLFRDYLRKNPERAQAYGKLKRQLAVEAVGDWKHYTGGKAGFVAETVRLALLDQSR